MLDMVFNENYGHCNKFNAVSSPIQKTKQNENFLLNFKQYLGSIPHNGHTD